MRNSFLRWNPSNLLFQNARRSYKFENRATIGLSNCLSTMQILSQKSMSSQAAKLFYDGTLIDMHELYVQNQNPTINSFQYFRVRAGRAI
jgi:hypothetical protein